MALHPTTTTIPRTGRGTGAEETRDDPGKSWADIEDVLRRGGATTWLSLPTGVGVHTRPVFAAWTGTDFVHASKAGTAKTRHLEAGGIGSLSMDLGDVHLTVEVRPRRLTAADDLKRARATFADVYDWPTTVVGDELDAPYAAPTSGGPPFRVYRLTPVRAFAFPAAGDFAPTRFRF